MFKWYEGSAECYALLSDLPPNVEPESLESYFSKCRWFTRGWCLQELIAPNRVSFYDCSWECVGSMPDSKGILGMVSGITRIPSNALTKKSFLEGFPIAERMSWAADRETTRAEDIAYCLMGIFDVNMPLIYGEGGKAFYRLQEEIIKKSPDLSIFDFDAKPEHAWINAGEHGDQEDYDEDGERYFACDLFACSPSDFAKGTYWSAISDSSAGPSFTMSNKGLHFAGVKLYVHREHDCS